MNMVCYIHLFITNYLLHVSVFATPSSGRPLHYLLKNYVLLAMLLYNVQYALFFFFKFTMLLQYLKQYVFHPSVSQKS